MMDHSIIKKSNTLPDTTPHPKKKKNKKVAKLTL